jgi:hypothetical protein
MANGYLGKISAVVSANTADFQSKLNASAKDVQAFARSVQSNLTSASREAARSFEGIYTPLQKFERSLQAAASMKLSFKGFAGAVKDVDVLRQRLGSMKDSQISLVLKASGMKNITDVREALVGLRAKDLQIVAKVGGIEKVRELRALSAEKRVDFAINLIDSGLSRRLADAKEKVQELKATVASVRDGGAAPTSGITGLASEYREATAEVRRLQEIGRQTIKTTLGVNVQKDADVDRILQAGERAESIRLPVVLDVLGEAAVKEAVTQSQRLRSVAEQINKPFGEAVQKISAMSVEVQASFLPAMKRSQSQVESLKSSIDKNVLPASAIAQQFDVVEKRVSAAVAAVNRLAEASQKISNMKTGRELAFTNPALAASLDRGVTMGNRAAGLPASAIQANPRIAAILGEYQDRANLAAAAYGRLQAKIASGLPTGSAERQLEGLQGRMAALATEFDRIYAAAAPDRNADRIGEMSPMDRNAGNIGARDSIRSMGARTSILDMGRSSPMDRNAGSIGARTSLGGQGARTDISDMGRMSSLEDRRRDLARQAVGEDIEAPRRQLAALAGSITSVKSQIDTLPDGVRTRFVPAIREAEAEFIRLSAAPRALPGAIDAARQRVQQLSADAARATQAMNFQQSFGGAGAAGLNLGLDQRALQGYNAQLQVLQGAIGRASAEARGPAVAAFERLRNAVANAFDEGNIDSGVQRDRLAAIRTEAIAAAASVSRIRVGSLTRDVARAGDVGRAGFDRFALAANQAGYAIDDFLSSTGGLEFKLRAISNNITQLAFILGGTTGLFIGLGAVIGGQVAISLIKWYNNGRTAEDQTKALNEALARQKSLVEELAQSFKALGDAMSRGTLSEGGQQARDFEEQVKDIRKKQKESREGRVFDLDPGVQRERAQQNAFKKQLEGETDIGRRVVITRQIRQSELAERAAMDRLRARPEPTGADVSGLIERAAARMEASGRSQRPSDTEFPVANAIRAAGNGLDAGDTPAAIRSQLAALDRATAAVSATSSQTFFGLPTEESATSNVAARAFAEMAERLKSKLETAIDAAAIKIAEASRGPAAQIRQAQEDVAEAIRRGVPAAADFQAELDANAKKLRAAGDAIEAAQSETDLTKKQAKVDEANANVAAVEAERADIDRRSREIRLGRTFGGDRTTAALSSLQGNERFRNERAGLTASIEAAIDREVAARGRLESATASGVDAEIKAARAELDLAQKASEAAAALAEAAAGIEAALTRIRKVGDSALQRSEQGADAAQKAFEENPQRAGGREARDAAEQRLIDDRAAVGNAQANVDNRRRAIQQDPQMQAINGELEAITQRRKDLEAKSAIGGGLNQAENAELDAAAKREIELLRQREMMARQLTDAERKQLDAINNGIIAREKELEALRRKAESDPSFDRRREAAGQIAEGARRQADEAQQRYINNPTEENRKRRDEADQRYREDRTKAEGLQDSLDAKRKAMQKDPRVVAIDKELKANNERLAELAEKEAKGGLTGRELKERERIQGRNRDIRGERDSIIDNGTRKEQGAIDDAQIAQNQRDRAIRGRDLGMTERDRRRKEFTEGAGADINARAKEMRDKGEDPSKFLRQALANQMEAVAPMLKQFQDERKNAILQGPSRAALNVSDVSTSQGASELTRLIRGDDSAKDVNLAELRKQSSYLEDIRNDLKANNPGVLL